jgi:hypothetical protein
MNVSVLPARSWRRHASECIDDLLGGIAEYAGQRWIHWPNPHPHIVLEDAQQENASPEVAPIK